MTVEHSIQNNDVYGLIQALLHAISKVRSNSEVKPFFSKFERK